MRLATRTAFVSLVSVVAVASASQVMPQWRTLDEVVSASPAILVVTPSKARSRVIEMPMKKGAPFARQQSPWVVEQVLRGDEQLKGRTIYLDAHKWQFNMMMAETIREGGPTPSTIEPMYKRLAKNAPADPEKRIFFLKQTNEDTFEEVVYEAVESVKYLDKVKAAIGENPYPNAGGFALPPKR